MIIQNVVTMKYTWSGQNLVIIAVTSLTLLAFFVFGVCSILVFKIHSCPKKMNSTIFLFLGHCGFRKCITFPSNKNLAQKSIFEHKAPYCKTDSFLTSNKLFIKGFSSPNKRGISIRFFEILV